MKNDPNKAAKPAANSGPKSASPIDWIAREMRIRAFLKRLGMTQMDLARKYGLRPNTLNSFIDGKRPNNLDVAAALEDLGFSEPRNPDGSLIGGPPIQRSNELGTEIGRSRYGHLRTTTTRAPLTSTTATRMSPASVEAV